MYEGQNIINCDDAELATIRAALRLYQDKGMGNPGNRSDAIHDLATNNDQVTSSLDDDGIDELVEKLNSPADSAEALSAS